MYSNNYFVVQKDGKEILAKKDGTEVVLNGLEEITGILKNTENGVIFVQGEKYGVMNLSGEVRIEAKYDDLKEAKSGAVSYTHLHMKKMMRCHKTLQ